MSGVRIRQIALLFVVGFWALVGWGCYAWSAEVTLKLSDQEQQQLIGLLDMAAKAGGIRAAPGVTYFAQKLQAAQAPVKPAGKPVEPEKK